MSNERQAILMLKGAIAELPPEERKKVETAIAELRAKIAESGDAGKIAMALISAELAAEI